MGHKIYAHILLSDHLDKSIHRLELLGFILVMGSSALLHSDCSSFTAAEPLLQAQVVNCIALNLNLSEAARNGVRDTEQPPVCICHSWMCWAVEVILES